MHHIHSGTLQESSRCVVVELVELHAGGPGFNAAPRRLVKPVEIEGPDQMALALHSPLEKTVQKPRSCVLEINQGTLKIPWQPNKS